MLNLSVERELAEGQSWDTALMGAVCPAEPVDIWSLSSKPQSGNSVTKPWNLMLEKSERLKRG